MTTFKQSFIRTFAGRIDHVIYALTFSWVLGMGLNYVTGHPMSIATALLTLLGNLTVIAIALAIKLRQQRN